MGKYTYEGSKLTFNRVGDIYTLSSATLNNGQTISNLDRFNNPKNGDTIYDWIFTNDFWPMDKVPEGNRKDRLFGATETTNRPPSDDGKDHNSYFGMQFALQFKLTKDYTGPLEYLFFGDDDMWVFLDGKLICDIGGVHSSRGRVRGPVGSLNAGQGRYPHPHLLLHRARRVRFHLLHALHPALRFGDPCPAGGRPPDREAGGRAWAAS